MYALRTYFLQCARKYSWVYVIVMPHPSPRVFESHTIPRANLEYSSWLCSNTSRQKSLWHILKSTPRLSRTPKIFWSIIAHRIFEAIVPKNVSGCFIFYAERNIPLKIREALHSFYPEVCFLKTQSRPWILAHLRVFWIRTTSKVNLGRPFEYDAHQNSLVSFGPHIAVLVLLSVSTQYLLQHCCMIITTWYQKFSQS